MNTTSTLPPTSAYYAYGAVSPPSTKVPFGSRNLKSDIFLEGQNEGLKMNDSAKGFLGFGLDDYLTLLATFVVPLLVFGAVYALVSFYFHYKYAPLAWILVSVIVAGVVFLGYIAISRMLREADNVSDHLAVWAAALFVGLVVALIAGLVCGLKNYGHHMQPYYEWKELNSYKNVDPNQMEGRAVMDAGVLNFKAGTHLDTAKAAGFMNLDMYCVAPIVSAGSAPDSYDFWAVGRNCCTGESNSFACGDPLKADQSSGGLRLLSDSELPFYKLAVTQAATTYNLKSAHPIFVHMVQDPSKAMSDHSSEGWVSFWPSLCYFAVFEGVVVAFAAMGVMIVKSKY